MCIDTRASLPSSKMLYQWENWMAFSLLSSMIAASSAPLTAVNSNTPSRCNRIFSASFSFSFKEQVGPSREVEDDAIVNTELLLLKSFNVFPRGEMANAWYINKTNVTKLAENVPLINVRCVCIANYQWERRWRLSREGFIICWFTEVHVPQCIAKDI